MFSRALIRPGRFDSRVTVPMPDVKARKSILELHLGNIKLSEGKPILEINCCLAANMSHSIDALM